MIDDYLFPSLQLKILRQYVCNMVAVVTSRLEYFVELYFNISGSCHLTLISLYFLTFEQLLSVLSKLASVKTLSRFSIDQKFYSVDIRLDLEPFFNWSSKRHLISRPLFNAIIYQWKFFGKVVATCSVSITFTRLIQEKFHRQLWRDWNSQSGTLKLVCAWNTTTL